MTGNFVSCQLVESSLSPFRTVVKWVELKLLRMPLCSMSLMREGGHRGGLTLRAQLGIVTCSRGVQWARRSEEPSAVNVFMCLVSPQIKTSQRVCLLFKLTRRPRCHSTGFRITLQGPTSEDVGPEAVEGSTGLGAVFLEAHFSQSLKAALLTVSRFTHPSVKCFGGNL